MSVLKKIGSVLLKAGEVASEIMGFPFIGQLLGARATAVTSAVTTGIGDLGAVAQILSLMESAFPSVNGARTGSAKLAAASPVVQQIILNWAQSNLPGHNKIKTSPEAFAQHVATFTGSFADILNDFGD